MYSTAHPLTDLRVLDLTDGLGDLCGRMLANLGANVLRTSFLPNVHDLSSNVRSVFLPCDYLPPTVVMSL